MNGNVGIGTWVPLAMFQVGNGYDPFAVDYNGNVGIGTSITSMAALNVMGGNVGIGTWVPAGLFQINNPAASPFVVTTAGNVGIGTTTPQTGLAITNGNVGIGTWTAGGGSLIVATGNVGIGSLTPGVKLDVFGTVRMTGLTMSGQTPSSGYVLTASDSGGDATWSSAGSVSGWTIAGNNIYNTNSGNVGINTLNGANVGIGTSTPQGALVVTNGNVGIGTWVPAKPFSVTGDTYHNGNVGIGTTFTITSALSVMGGNVGIGTWVPVQTLEVNGTIQADTQYNYPAGYGELADSSGDVHVPQTLVDSAGSYGASSQCFIISSVTGLAVWGSCTGTGSGSATPPANPLTSVQFNNSGAFGGSAKFVFNGTNVGIGTALSKNTLDVSSNAAIGATYAGYTAAPANGLLVQGNVGIGTLVTLGALQVGAFSSSTSGFVVGSTGNVGIGTTLTTKASLSVMNGNVGIGTWLPGAALIVMGGNIGIGTTISAYNLDIVNGTARERVVRRVITTPGSSSPITINSDIADLFTITAMAQASTINITAGTPNNGDLLEIRILDNGTARALTWGAAGATIASTSTTLPLTTVVSTTLRVLLEYNTASTRWECIGVT